MVIIVGLVVVGGLTAFALTRGDDDSAVTESAASETPEVTTSSAAPSTTSTPATTTTAAPTTTAPTTTSTTTTTTTTTSSTTSTTTTTTTTLRPRTTIAWTLLTVGRCVETIPPGEFETLVAVDCAEPHEAEVISVSRSVIRPVTIDTCLTAFENYTGVSADDSAFDVGVIEGTSNIGIASFTSLCIAVSDEIGMLTTGSLATDA